MRRILPLVVASIAAGGLVVAGEFAARAVLWAVALIIFGAVLPEFVSREGPHRRAWVGLVISVLMIAVGIWWDSLGRLIPFIVGSWSAGLIVSGVIAALGIAWLISHKRAKRAARKGRKGLLNVVIDVPKAKRAQNARLGAIGNLIGELVSVVKASSENVDATAPKSRLKGAEKFAAAVSPISAKLRKEADALQSETKQFSDGLERWVEIAERDSNDYGLTEQVPELINMRESAIKVRQELEPWRKTFTKLSTLSDAADVSCGEVVESLDTIECVAKDSAALCESSLRRIKKLLQSGNDQ
jgi:hypothetical protein